MKTTVFSFMLMLMMVPYLVPEENGAEIVNRFRKASAEERVAIRKQILELATKSPEMRADLISATVRLIDDATVEFPVWRDAVQLLCAFETEQAASVLAKHISRSEGTVGLSSSHYPALQCLRTMGSSAVPSLSPLLKAADKGKRINAARALGEIGGEESTNALEAALRVETDPAVTQSISDALKRSTSKHKTP